MTEHSLLKHLANSLLNDDEKAIKMYILDGHSVRDAILYLDVYLKRNYLVEKFKKYAFCDCECSNYTAHFNPKPICRGCHFTNEIRNKIEYGKQN